MNFFSLDVTDDGLRANIDWKSPFLKRVGYFGLKFQVDGKVSFVSSQFTRLTDRQTDGRTDAHSKTANAQLQRGKNLPLLVFIKATPTIVEEAFIFYL